MFVSLSAPFSTFFFFLCIVDIMIVVLSWISTVFNTDAKSKPLSRKKHMTYARSQRGLRTEKEAEKEVEKEAEKLKFRKVSRRCDLFWWATCMVVTYEGYL